MCRHVCPVTRVTYNEATSPHGWALTIASVRRGLLDWNAETADLLYQCADCGLCQSFCATDQPLPYAIVAARAEIAAAGHAPATVATLDAALRGWGHPYASSHPLTPSATAIADGLGSRVETVLFVGATAWHRERASLDAARRLLTAAGVAHGLASAGRSSGYLAYTLGLHDTARDLARATVEELERGGCRTLVVLSPEHAHTFRSVYPLLGTPLPEDIEVVELTTLLAGLLEEGRLRLRASSLDLAYHDPCQTPRLPGRWHAPRRLLAAITSRAPREGFWREQRAANCGASGGLPWTQPLLANRMARATLADAANGCVSLIVTEAPGCLAHLRANTGQGVKVRGLYELLAEHLEA
jgi:Fe-S oxidoreductase